MKKTGAQLLCDALIREGVKVVFGIPGGVVLSLYDQLNRPEYEQHFKHILPGQEQGGGFAADGYARVTGQVGVAIGTSGPGATNLLTAMENAMMDSVPVVFITGQVLDGLVGTDAFQEADMIGMTLSAVKHSFFVNTAADVAAVMAKAFYIAKTGRPGPVHVDFAKDVWLMTADGTDISAAAPTTIYLPGYSERVSSVATDEDICTLDTILAQPHAKPIIIAGHGVELANATNELVKFAERHHLPVVNTILGMGTFPQNHPLWMGMIGMHGDAATNYAVAEANVIISLGSRFDDRITGRLQEFIAEKTFVHCDIDASEMNKIVPTALPLVGDVKRTLQRAEQLLSSHSYPEWWQRLQELKQQFHFRALPDYHGAYLSQPYVVDLISRHTNGQAIVAADVGRHQMWVARFYQFAQSHSHLSSGGLGAMGYGVPAAMGAALAAPKRSVWAIVGDGGFMMNVQELRTLAQYNIPVKIAIMADGVLGMIHQWQELLYRNHFSNAHLYSPDYVKLAEAFSIPAWTVRTPAEAEAAVAAAQATSGPALIAFTVDPHENVFPMVPPNTSLQQQALSPENVRPVV